MDDVIDRLAIGGNQPPTPAQEVRERLPVQYAELATQVAMALSTVEVPDSVTSDAEAVACQEVASVLMDVGKDVERALRAERFLYKDAQATVVKYFTDIVGPVSATIALMQSRVRSYQLSKAEQVRRAARAFGAGEVATRDAGRIHTADGRVAVAAVAETVYRIVNVDELPRDLMRPDPVLIHARINRLKAAGSPLEIPGLMISEEMRTQWQRNHKASK